MENTIKQGENGVHVYSDKKEVHFFSWNDDFAYNKALLLIRQLDEWEIYESYITKYGKDLIEWMEVNNYVIQSVPHIIETFPPTFYLMDGETEICRGNMETIIKFKHKRVL